MTSIRTVFAPFLLATLMVPTLIQAKDNPDERAIRQTLSSYESALNASDTTTILGLYTKDGVQMAPDAPPAVGRDAVKAAYEGTFKAVSLDLKFTVDEVKVLGKSSALVRSHSDGTLKINGIGQPGAPAAFKELFILNKQADGEWKFSHYSFSAMSIAKE